MIPKDPKLRPGSVAVVGTPISPYATIWTQAWDGEWENEAPVWPSKKKCECGVASVGGSRHSDWCPLYTPPNMEKDRDE